MKIKHLGVVAAGLLSSLVSLLALSGRAEAGTYYFPVNETISAYVSGDIPTQVSGHYSLSPSPFDLLPSPSTCPDLTFCQFGITANANVTNSIPVIGNLVAVVSTAAFGGSGVCGIPFGPICRSLYVTGFFLLDDTSRLLTITSDDLVFSDGYTVPPQLVFLAITLPDGLVLGETPLPATLPLFATGLGAFGLLRWRRKQKVAHFNAGVWQ